jgi:SnoaL-like domain
MEVLVSNTLGQLMERNVLEVFGERDSERRKSVINGLYTENCIFFEPDEKIVGRDALNARVDQILQGTPGFVFRLAGPAEVNHDHGRLRWRFGPDGGAPVVTGMDVAVFEHGRISALYAFPDKAPSNTAPSKGGRQEPLSTTESSTTVK